MTRKKDWVRPGTVGSYSTIGSDKQEKPLTLLERAEMILLFVAFTLLYIIFEVAF